MKTKLSLRIITKLILGFGLILISFLAAYIYIYNTLNKNQELTEKVTNNIVPSMSELNKFSYIVYESTHLVKNWVLYEKESNTPKKFRLKQINQNIYIQIKYELRNLSQEWDEEEQLKLEQILNLADNYFILTEEIIRSLNTPEKYNDPEFQEKYANHVKDGSPMMDLAENIKNQTDEMYASKKDALLSYTVETESSFISFSKMIIISGILLIFTILLIAFLFVNSMITPINTIRRIIKLMSAGEFPKTKIKTSTDEIGQMGSALENLLAGLRDKANFARDIEKGNFNSFYKASGKNDILGNSLLAMRDSLSRAAQEENKRRKENEERSWSTQGISEFNTLIRDHSDNPEEFSLVTINKLTRYTGSQVGGFYILNEKDKKNIFLELIAFYAYDRHKFFERFIEPGQNLVGQAYLEKDTIFLSDIPENYIKISSGLGQKNPKSILIVPLIVNEKVYGVVELASMEIYEKYKIEFVEKVGEILASTIATIQINQQTAQILEESREKSEILEHQEKESIKNIEQLNTELENANNTIEQLKKKIDELTKIQEENVKKEEKEEKEEKVIKDNSQDDKIQEKEKKKIIIDPDIEKREVEREKRNPEGIKNSKEGEKDNVESVKTEENTELKSIDPDLQKRKEEREKRRLERLKNIKEAEKDNVEEVKTVEKTELKSIDPDLQKRKEEREKRRLERLKKRKEAENNEKTDDGKNE